jgi:hypothetical protein
VSEDDSQMVVDEPARRKHVRRVRPVVELVARTQARR